MSRRRTSEQLIAELRAAAEDEAYGGPVEATDEAIDAVAERLLQLEDELDRRPPLRAKPCAPGWHGFAVLRGLRALTRKG